MTWTERHLMLAGRNVNLAYGLLKEALNALDVSEYPMAFGLIKGAIATTEVADKALSESIHDATERINQ